MPRTQEPNEDRDKLFAESLVSPPFVSARFKAFLNRGTLRYLRDGDMSVSFVIPLESVQDAESLRLLLTNPVPLDISIEVDKSYAEDMVEIEKALGRL